MWYNTVILSNHRPIVPAAGGENVMNEPNYFIPERSFHIFGLEIYYYAVMIVLGILCAIVAVSFLFKRRNISVDWVVDLLLCILPLGIIGARTFYVLTDPSTSMAEWFTHFRDGGLSIIGGVIGGAVGVVLFCLIHKINFLRVADCLMPGVILAQGIGRWGNFFNQEVYGALVENPSMQWFPLSVYIESAKEWHLAFFFYESLTNFLIFGLLFALMWNFRKKPHGLSTAGYFFGYGLVRSIMEPLRDPTFILGSSAPVSQVFAILMCVGGVLLAAGVIAWNRYKNGSFFGAAEGKEPLAILPRYYSADERKKMEEARLAKERAVASAGEKAADKGVSGKDADTEKTEAGEENSILICPACGARIEVSEKGVSKCPYCGAPVKPDEKGEEGK